MNLVYDINSLPEGLNPTSIVKILENHKTVFWDSSKSGLKPKFYSKVEGDSEVFIVDTSGKSIDVEAWTQEYVNKEFWDKELYKVKRSPTYLFSEYLTTQWPVQQSQLSEYLKSIGLTSISESGADSTDAAKVWEKQKEKVREATKDISIEFLQERKAVVDVMRTTYESKVTDLEEKLKDTVKLKEQNGESLPPKKKIAKLCEKIRKCSPIPPKYGHYRNKKGRWDAAMLYVTDYDVLLQMLYELHFGQDKG